jgi:hypothetical protein
MLEICPSFQKKSTPWLGPHCEVSCEFEYLVEFAAIFENLYYISKAQVLMRNSQILRKKNFLIFDEISRNIVQDVVPIFIKSPSKHILRSPATGICIKDEWKCQTHSVYESLRLFIVCKTLGDPCVAVSVQLRAVRNIRGQNFARLISYFAKFIKFCKKRNLLFV